jgi:membrane protein required for colicin V production
MPTFNELTSFDLAVACIFALFLARGAWIGLVRQLAAFLALVGSYLLAARYAVQFSPLAGQFVANPRLTFFISFAVIFLVAALLFTLIGKLLRGVMVLTLLGWFDRLLGLVLGGVKALVVCSLVYMALASTLSTTNDLLRRSWSSPWLKRGRDRAPGAHRRSPGAPVLSAEGAGHPQPAAAGQGRRKAGRGRRNSRVPLSGPQPLASASSRSR